MNGIAKIDLIGAVRRAPVPASVARRARLVELREEALDFAARNGLITPRANWRIHPLDGETGEHGRLCVDGKSITAPWLIPESGKLTGIACGVATIGEGIDEAVAALFAERKASLGVALDSVGNELLFALSRRVEDRMLADARKMGLSVAGELRAGDPGLALAAQECVLALAGAESTGITLTRTMMMRPVKSTALVQGVGYDLPKQSWSRCTICPSRERCTLAEAA